MLMKMITARETQGADFNTMQELQKQSVFVIVHQC